MAATQLETDAEVGLEPSPQTTASPPALESDSDVGLAPPAPPAPPAQDPELEQALLERARTVSPLGMAATGLEALRRVTEAKLGVATPERGRTVPEIQRQLLREPQQSFAGQLTEPVVHYQPFKIEREDHPLTAIGKEAANVAISLPEFFTSPLGVLTPGLAQAFPVSTGLAFTADMLYNLGRGIVSTIKGWTGMSTGQKAASIVDLGANGLMALALGRQTKKAGEEALFRPAPGRTVPPEVQAWAATFGVGTGEPETAIRTPPVRVLPTQPFVPPSPGPMQPIPRPEELTLLSRDEANMQGPEAVTYIMAKFGVDRDTAVSIQQSNRSRLGITRTPAAQTTTEERTTDVTPTGVRIEPSGQTPQLPRAETREDLRTNAPEVRQAQGTETDAGDRPVASPQGQEAPPAPDVTPGTTIDHPIVGRSFTVQYQLTPSSQPHDVTVTVTGVSHGEPTRTGKSTIEVHFSDGQHITVQTGASVGIAGRTIDEAIQEALNRRGARPAAPPAPDELTNLMERLGVSRTEAESLMAARDLLEARDILRSALRRKGIETRSLGAPDDPGATHHNETVEAAMDESLNYMLEEAGWTPSPTPPAAPPVQPPVEPPPAAPPESPRPPKGERVEFTSENIERGRAMIAQAVQIAKQRQLTDEHRRAIGLEIENVRKGYYQGMQELLDEIGRAPLKQKPVPRPPTDALDRFDAETEALKDRIGEEDILSWLRDKMPLLSKSGFKKKFGARRAKENASLYEGAPGKNEIPMHHQVAIYREDGDGPDVVAKSAARDGKLKGVTEESASADDLWDEIRHAIAVRKGATGERAGETESEYYTRLEREAEQQHLNWVARIKEAEPGKEVPITADQLGIGDVLELDGERIKVMDLDPDTEELILLGGKLFGEQRVREGDPIFYVQKLEKAAEADFAPEEPPAEPAKLELPKVPGPLPKGIPKADREEAFRQQRERWDKYNADLAAWEAAQPQNKPIIFRRENGSHAAITPDPQGGWRVTTFTKLYRDLDKLAPWGHERYNTRLEAVNGMLSGGRDGEIVDALPEVMTEEEIRQENERRNAPEAQSPAELDRQGVDKRWVVMGAVANNKPINAELFEAVFEDRPYRSDSKYPSGYVKEGNQYVVKAPATPPPTLRPGEAAGELFQGADQPFNLAGEAGSDADRLAAERAAAEQRAKEAADLAAKQQPDLPVEPPKSAGAAAGTRVGNYIKGDDGWYLVDEEGNRRNVPRANKKISARLEEQAAAPPLPPETRSQIEVLAQATKVRVKVPKGATKIRITDSRGRTSEEFIPKLESGPNVFRGVDIAKIEAGFINKDKRFQVIDGDVTVEDVGRRTMHSLEPRFDWEPPKNLLEQLETTLNPQEAFLQREAPIRQKNLSELTGGKSLWHETSLQNAVDVFRGFLRQLKRSWTGMFLTDNPDLALAQGGKRGFLFEIDPERVNGFRHPKPGTSEQTGFEYSLDKSIYRAIKSITFATRRQLEAFQRRFPNYFDYENAVQTERGLKVLPRVPRAEQSLEAAFPPGKPATPVMSPEEVTAHIEQMFPGAQMIRVVNDPNARMSGQAHFDDDFTKLLGIDINAAAMRDAAHIRWVVEHEIAHAADKLGNIRPLLDGITDGEFMAILKDVEKRGYELDAFGDEVAARSLQMLASDWKGRSWFEKLLGTILKLANDVGYKMTRIAAEKIAAKAMADATKLVGEKSQLNGYSATRTLQSLPLKPEDWHMKQWFDAIGLQAATIGGYLHRYTRQVFHADELGVSDRARSLDGMVEARQLTELAQGMGGRVNYFDAIANATSNGERSEVLSSAFESVERYQMMGVDLRRKEAEKRAVLQSEKFRNKLTQASRRREKAELTEEIRRTYTQQIAAAAGRITEQLNNLRTVGAMHEQLQADLTRLQTMPEFDNAVAQHFNTIVDRLAQTDRGLSLLMGGGDRLGQEIWDEYMRLRFADGQGIPQGNEFALGQLASAVLAVNRDLRNQFASLALLSRDIVTTQEWNRAGSMIAQSIQNDPQAAIPRILQRAGNLGERAGRAEAAWLALNKDIERTLRDYSQHEEAVRLHNAVETDPEYRQWVNEVLTHPDLQGLQIPSEVLARMEASGRREPFFKYSGQDTLYSPQGKPYVINMQFTPDNVQATMSDLIKLGADITDWLEQPENQNNPDRLYWQERQRMIEGVLMSSAIWNPGAMDPAITKSSFGMPENFYQGLALPSAKLAFLAQKAFDRYWAQGKGWYGNNYDLSERATQLAYKSHGFNELNRKDYQQSILNALAWEFRNGHVVRVGDIVNGHKINAEDITLLFVQGRMTNDLYERMWTAAKASGAEGVTELPRLIAEFTGGAWGIRKPLEIGVHKNTTLPHNFSNHGEALANDVHGLIAARNAELAKLPQRVIDEAMTPDQQNFERADIQRRFNESLAQTLNDPNVFQNAVLGFMRQRSDNWVKLDGLSPFEEHYREITRLVSEGNAGAPKTIEEVLDYLNQHVPADMTPAEVKTQFFGELEKLTERFYKMHSDPGTGIKVTSDKRTTAFTKGFQQDLGPAYFYDYGWIDAGEMRRYSTDMGEFGFERMMESMHALRQNMKEAVSQLVDASEARKPEIIRRTMAEYHEGRDFRNLQTLQAKILELDRLIENMPRWSGVNVVHAEGISLKSANRFVSFMIGAALTGPRTAARISGISMGGSAWKMGIVFSQLGYGRLRSFPAAAASAITSAFRIGTATGIGWYQPGKGLVPGVPIRLLLNIPGAIKAGLAKEGSERIYSAIEAVLKGTTDEQFAALGWWNDQKLLGMTPDSPIGARVANILSASRTKGGVLSRPETPAITRGGTVMQAARLAVSKVWALGEAFVAGTNVYLPGAFGYNITYDAVGRQAGWYIDMLAANARRTFDTYEKLGQLGRFNFDNRTDPRNKLLPWEVLPSFAGRFRFVDPARLPAWARPNSTNLQLARELFSTSTDIDLQDLLISYWKRLSETAPEQRGAVEFLAPEELDAAQAKEKAEGRARGIISRFVEQTHHAAPSNRPYQLQKATAIQAILPFMGWSAQTLKLIDTTLGKVAFSAEARGIQADTYAGLMIAAGLTALGVSAFAFAGGDLEARMIRQLDRLFHNKEGTVKTIDEARDMKEAAEITLHNMTAGIPMLNSTLNQLLGMTGYRGGNVGFQAFAFDKLNSMITYARDVYRTHDLTHGLDRLAEANIPISETIIENTFQREGLQNNRNAVRVLQKFGPQDLVERRASLSIALPTEMTPYRQALVEAIGSGNQELVAQAYQSFIQKATELGRGEPDKLARQMFSTLNPYRQAFGGVLTDQQRADTLAKMSPVQRKMVETMEQNYGLAAATLGLSSEFEKAEKAPPLQRGGTAGAGGQAIGLPSGGGAAVGGGLRRAGTGLRRISLSGPRAPRIRLPGVSGVSRGGTRARSGTASRTRFVHGRLSSRSPRARRLTARRSARRRISLNA